MLADLKFVQGAVAKKDFMPALTHFVIEKNTVRGYNGTIALCSPLPFDIACKPKADAMVRAIANCGETVAMSMTPAGRLSIKSGPFRALVDCVEGETPHAEPEGEEVTIDGEGLLRALKAVEPFIGDDASRRWSTGVLLRGQSAFATCNVALVEYWVGSTFPVTVNLPDKAVREIIRINEAPIRAQCTANSFSLHYANGRWIRTQLLETDWPDLTRILDAPGGAEPIPVNPKLFEGLDVLRPFVDKMGRVLFKEGVLQTNDSAEEGATFEVPDFPYQGTYNIEILRLLKGVATGMDWTAYPRPCKFFGDRLRGALVGMRDMAPPATT